MLPATRKKDFLLSLSPSFEAAFLLLNLWPYGLLFLCLANSNASFFPVLDSSLVREGESGGQHCIRSRKQEAHTTACYPSPSFVLVVLTFAEFSYLYKKQDREAEGDMPVYNARPEVRPPEL